jgi:hypothetical protein
MNSFLYILSFTLLIYSNLASGQKQGNIWLFGEGGGLDFNSGNPVSFSGSQLYGMPTQPLDFPYAESSTSISDSAGTLLFYSNGMKVWNKLHQLMPNGDSLMGFSSSSSAAFAIPKPNSDSLFYLFTTDGLEHQLRNGLRYSVINMCLDGGKGDVKKTQKNILLLDTVSEKLCAVAHPNGTDTWLITHKYHTSVFYSYLITPTGINSPVITNIGSVHTASSFSTFGAAIGSMKASPNGSLIALAYCNTIPTAVELFNFNSTTGVLTNSLSLSTNNNGDDGVAFSPDNSKLFVSTLQGIYQYDLSVYNLPSINASRTQITNMGALPSALQLGPDGKIYYARSSNKLSVINTPNALGAACNFSLDIVSIGSATNCFSLPLFISDYNYKNKIAACSVIGILENIEENLTVSVYPNPVSNSLNIVFISPNATRHLTILNSLGQKIYTSVINFTTSVIDFSSFDSGLYCIVISSDTGTVRRKIIKQ